MKINKLKLLFIATISTGLFCSQSSYSSDNSEKQSDFEPTTKRKVQVEGKPTVRTTYNTRSGSSKKYNCPDVADSFQKKKLKSGDINFSEPATKRKVQVEGKPTVKTTYKTKKEGKK